MKNTTQLMIASLALALTATPFAAAGNDLCGEWAQIPAPAPPESIGIWLTDVAALSPDNAWAVGRIEVAITPYTSEHYTYILHWNGTDWQRVPSPSPGLAYDGGTQCFLEAVEAIAPDDVWAVGHYKTQQSHGHVGPQPLTLHWDGSSWSQIAAPQSQGESSGAILFDIDALASDDIWAGGIWPSPAGYGFPAFMLHWNGSNWTVHNTPNAAYSQRIRAIKAIASDNVWAVGGSGNSWAQSYVIHYDGNSWSQVSAPSPYFWNFLNDIDGSGPDDLWIAGQKWDVDISYTPFMLRWDGSSWSEVDSPGGGQSIVALGPNDVWSADVWTTGSSIAHFDGESWTVQATVAGPAQSTLLGMTRVGECDAWAVGREVGTGSGYLPLVQRFTAKDADPNTDAADINNDGTVGVADLLESINSWGACPPSPASCPADIAPPPNGDGAVGVDDLLFIIAHWG